MYLSAEDIITRVNMNGYKRVVQLIINRTRLTNNLETAREIVDECMSGNDPIGDKKTCPNCGQIMYELVGIDRKIDDEKSG